MRKSFILSLVMVVVLIASLATATFAWYTAQTQVVATETTVTTANAGESIVIKRVLITSPNETNNSVDLTMETAGVGREKIYDPAVLKSTTSTAYQSYDFADLVVLSNTVNKSGLFNGTPAEFNPAKVVAVKDNEGTNDTGYIFVGNVGGAAAGTKAYKVTVTLGTEVDSCLRVALFKATVTDAASVSALTPASFELLGIFSAGNTNVLYASALTNGTAPGSTSIAAADTAGDGKVYKSGTAIAAGTLGNRLATNDVYRIAVWFEGNKLTNSGVNTEIAFDISFEF